MDTTMSKSQLRHRNGSGQSLNLADGSVKSTWSPDISFPSSRGSRKGRTYYGVVGVERQRRPHSTHSHTHIPLQPYPQQIRFEDSSSLSSGLSENIDEISTDDLTGSSLSDHHNVYAAHFHASPNPHNKNNRNNKHPSLLQQQQLHTRGRIPQAGGSSGRRVETFSGETRQDSGQVGTNNANGSLQQRKLSEQESINQLLQKSRTSARGLGIVGSGTPQSTRPKSEQMNGIPISVAPYPNKTPGAYASQTLNGPLRLNGTGAYKVQLSNDDQTLRVSSAQVQTQLQSNGGQGQFNGHPQQFRGRTPLTGNTLKLLRSDEGEERRPGSAQGCVISQHQQPPMPNSARGYGNGFHSLDRKRHLMGYYSETDAIYANYGGQQQQKLYNHTTLAMVSPRRLPMSSGIPHGSLSLGVSHEGPLPLPSTDEDAWTRQSLAQPSNGSPQHPKQQQQQQQRQRLQQHHERRHQSQSPSMSRSMIEQSRNNLKLSPQNPAQQAPRSGINGCTTGNASARFSVPPPDKDLSPNGTSQATHGNGVGRMARSGGGPRGPGEGIYANLIQRTNISSRQGQTSHDEERTSPLSPSALSAPAGGVGGGGGGGSVGSNGALASHYPPGTSPYLANMLNKVGTGQPLTEEELIHGSTLSLASNSSSFYAKCDPLQPNEEKYQAEIRKLHREVEGYKDKVKSLTAQQSTYTTMVQAFEKALQGMAKRVESLQSVSQQKEAEVSDLRQRILLLREMGLQAGINVPEDVIPASPSLHRRHTFNDPNIPQGLMRQPSCESVVSTISQKSTLSTSSKGSRAPDNKGKKSWIRSSFSKAFKSKKNKNGSMSDVEEVPHENGYNNPSPSPLNSARTNRDSTSALSDVDTTEVVELLKDRLAEKDSKLTDMRLDYLTSAQEMDQLKTALIKLKTENSFLKQDKERLKKMMEKGGSHSSLPLLSDGEGEGASDYGGTMSDVVHHSAFNHSADTHGDTVRVRILVVLNLAGNLDTVHSTSNPASHISRDPSSLDQTSHQVLIGQLNIGPQTTWDKLDESIGKVFNEYLHKIDPVGNLNLNNFESILGYSVGATVRTKTDAACPQQLPSLSLSNTHNSIHIILRGVCQNAVDALSFETLIPKSYLLRLVMQIEGGKRAIICGSCGIGKTYLARKLAEYAVLKSESQVRENSVSLFQVSSDDSAAAQLKAHLENVMEQYRRQDADRPTVLILDNLSNLNFNSFTEVFSTLSSNKTGPYIIGTMSETPPPTLQINHNFKILILPNHTDPVKGFLGRYLRRRLIQDEVNRGGRCAQEMVRVLEWLPKVWEHLNKYLEVVNLTHVTIGPRVFLSCPLGLEESRDWFVELWNKNIHPYLIQATREGAQMGRGRGSLEDPTDFVCDSWPWNDEMIPDTVLNTLSPEDIDMHPEGENTPKVDPLMMLVRLCGEQSKQNKNDLVLTDP